MRVSVQTDDLNMLKEAVESDCHAVRFGPEFCEWKIPSLDLLKEAYELVVGEGKGFIYTTPFVSNSGIERVREHLTLLNQKGRIDVVINDLGTFNIIGNYPNLRPRLGRQLVFIPARCPWKEITQTPVGFFERRHLERIFYQTSLNYTPTIRFYQKHGVEDVDVDWIPQSFPYYDSLIKHGFNLSMHLQLIPVTVTRRCHMARFLGERSPESCTKPCNSQAFMLKNNLLKVELFLNGNVIFRLTEMTQRDTEHLRKRAAEFIISMNPAVKMNSRTRINALIKDLNS